MSAADTGRYERKYVVSESTALAIRPFVATHMQPDPFVAAGMPWGYRVQSLYLDTPQFGLYRQTVEGIKNRYKLRIRFYDTAEGSPAFLEVKRRIADTIYKQRAAVTKPAAERLLRGERAGMADLFDRDEKSVRALADFCERQSRLGARGTAFTSYWREAYVSPYAEGARVTFDRHVVGHTYHAADGLTMPPQGTAATSDEVVLELKYLGRSPGWMKDLVRSFGLVRVTFPKYVVCVDALCLAPGPGKLTNCGV